MTCTDTTTYEDGPLNAAAKLYGNIREAAAFMNIPRSSFWKMLQVEKGLRAPPKYKHLTQGEKAAQAAQVAQAARETVQAVQQPAVEPTTEKPRIRVKAGSSMHLLNGKVASQPQGPASPIQRPMYGVRGARQANLVAPVSDQLLTTCFIGDLHGHPAIADECSRSLALIGEHIVATRPDAVVVGGDWMDWASACHHERNDTWRGRFKPTLEEDIAECRNLLAVLAHYLDLAGITTRVFTWGNHEEWVSHFENTNPEAHGTYTDRILSMFEEAGFSSFQYGEYAFLHGVGYTHAPKNKMDRPVGGVTAENTVAMNATHDVVFGHTHVFAMGKRVKFGYRNAVTVINGGSCMPVDYVGDYAQKNMGSFIDSGVTDIHTQDGRISGHAHLPMQLLEKKHSVKATAYLSSIGRG